ncbi:hypothetical protein OIO90_006548 [Microbotryomycetes sp. JL221]|nr:hypothetical protein OIO90_006548 [Microbotryomycetes sp. JL221]
MGSMTCPSWLEYNEDSHFSLLNIPFGIVTVGTSTSSGSVAASKVAATRVGDFVVDLSVLETYGLLKQQFADAEATYFDKPVLNDFANLPNAIRRAVRQQIRQLLSSNCSTIRDNESLRQSSIHKITDVITHVPFRIGDFIDYSVFPAHGIGAGRAIFGPETKLPPSFACMPMAYNGRSSTVTVKEEIVRPQGQLRAFSKDREVTIGECRALDWEFEIGAFISRPSEADTYLTPEQAASHVFGYVILNDWSARDVQSFEMVPLGPFNGKSFATTITPWVVTAEALEEFSAPLPARLTDMPFQQPEYLNCGQDVKPNYHVQCETRLSLASDPSSQHVISRATFADAYWSFPQLIAHQTYNGAPVQTGDLLGSGTISNWTDDSKGCMLELGVGGKQPIKVGSNGEERCWIQDGDEVVMSAWAFDKGKSEKVGFGELRGKVRPAKLLRQADE